MTKEFIPIVIQESTAKQMKHAAEELERGAEALEKLIGSGKAGGVETRDVLAKARLRMIRGKCRLNEALHPKRALTVSETSHIEHDGDTDLDYKLDSEITGEDIKES